MCSSYGWYKGKNLACDPHYILVNIELTNVSFNLGRNVSVFRFATCKMQKKKLFGYIIREIYKN